MNLSVKSGRVKLGAQEFAAHPHSIAQDPQKKPWIISFTATTALAADELATPGAKLMFSKKNTPNVNVESSFF